MVDFQTYQKTTFLINNNKKNQIRAEDADHKHLLESQLSVWVERAFHFVYPQPPSNIPSLHGQYLLFLQEKENLSLK